MGGQIEPLQELAYNIHFFNIQVIFDFADIFVSHENKSKSSFESLRNVSPIHFKKRGSVHYVLMAETAFC